MSQETFSDTLIRLEAEYLYFVQKLSFFQGVSPGFLVKNDQILMSAFFTCLCPQRSRRVVKVPCELFSSANNTLTKNFMFNSRPDFIFCGLFLCPLSLGRPKKCLKGRFRTQ